MHQILLHNWTYKLLYPSIYYKYTIKHTSIIFLFIYFSYKHKKTLIFIQLLIFFSTFVN